MGEAGVKDVGERRSRAREADNRELIGAEQGGLLWRAPITAQIFTAAWRKRGRKGRKGGREGEERKETKRKGECFGKIWMEEGRKRGRGKKKKKKGG